YARPQDVLIGLSTSGDSPNVVKALEVGKRLSLLTIALTGKGGGTCAQLADFAFAVPSHNILRIQECHLTLYHVLWDMVHTLRHYEPELRQPMPESRPAPAEHADESAPVDPALAQLYPFLFKQ